MPKNLSRSHPGNGPTKRFHSMVFLFLITPLVLSLTLAPRKSAAAASRAELKIIKQSTKTLKRSRKTRERVEAVNKLGRIKKAEAVPLLIKVLSDSNGDVRRAALSCDGQVIKLLLTAGADMNHKDPSGMTAFEMTLWSGSDAGDALIDAGFRLPAKKVKQLRKSYKDNPKALKLLNRAER